MLPRLVPLICGLALLGLVPAPGTLAASPTSAAANEDGVSRGPIIAPGARVERVFAGGSFLEGPAQAPDGRIFFSDLTQTWRTGMAAGYVWVHDPATGRTSIYRSPSGMSAGLAFDRQGRLIAAHGADFGGRYVSRTDLATGKATILAGLYDGRPFNSPNDVDIDAQGRIYFTDPRYFGHEPIEQPLAGVYRIDPDGTVKLVLADVSRPNGIAVAPDGKSLYLTENDYFLADRRIDKSLPLRDGDMKLLRYDLSPDGVPTHRRVLVDYAGEGGGGGDGIEVDHAGNIYVAVRTRRQGVRVYDPNGRQLAEVRLPEQPSNLTLARVDGRTWLYVTAGTSLYRIPTLVAPRE